MALAATSVIAELPSGYSYKRPQSFGGNSGGGHGSSFGGSGFGGGFSSGGGGGNEMKIF